MLLYSSKDYTKNEKRPQNMIFFTTYRIPAARLNKAPSSIISAALEDKDRHERIRILGESRCTKEDNMTIAEC